MQGDVSGSGQQHGKQPQQQQQQQQQQPRRETRVVRIDPALLEAAAAAPAERYALPGAAGAGPELAAALAALHEAGALLRAGELVALPTETVYGLAASALDAAAVARVFEAKGRPSDNPLIVHVSDLAMLRALYPPAAAAAAQGSSGGSGSGEKQEGGSSQQQQQQQSVSASTDGSDPIPAAYAAAIAAHWPGPLTVLLPASPLVPACVTAGHATMAVRMPSHPVARAAIAAAGVPLAAPSANSSGRPSPTRAAHVVADLAGRLPLVVDGGECGCGVESTVLDALRSPPAVLRPGGVAVEALAALPGLGALMLHGREFRDAALEAAPTTPGMKYRHYAPSAPVWAVEPPPSAGAADAVREAVAAAARAAAGELLRAGRARVALLRTTLPAGTARGWQDGGDSSWHADGSSTSTASVREYCLGPISEPAGVARALFAGLRDAEAAGADAIVVEGVADAGDGAAVMNRLRKAASRVVQA